MIFDKDYDRSLWLMLAGDEINRGKIAEVIMNTSSELIKQIRLLLEEYNSEVCDKKTISFEGNNLSYNVTICGDELSLKMVKFDGIQKEEIELFLFPMNESVLSSMKQFSSEHLGGFSYNLSAGHSVTIGSALEEYDIFKTPVGHYVKLYSDNKIKPVHVRRVNSSKIPDALYTYQFRTSDSINKLVRRRKKGNRYHR